MKTICFAWAALSFLVLFSGSVFAFTAPNPTLTPGVLCSASDPNFDKYDYPEHIARCARNVDDQEKHDIAQEYGNLPQSEWPKYEFDHYIPLCAGGSDDIKNLWPQPLAEAHEKDKLENDICVAMSAGKLTQAEAVQKVHDWFQSRATADGAGQDQQP